MNKMNVINEHGILYSQLLIYKKNMAIDRKLPIGSSPTCRKDSIMGLEINFKIKRVINFALVKANSMPKKDGTRLSQTYQRTLLVA